MYIKIIKLDKVDSTNNYVCKLAEAGARETTVVIAKEQSKGKGRLGKYWASPRNKGVYASFVFRPGNSLRDIYYLPLVFSLAVARLLTDKLDSQTSGASNDSQIKIKLPNDVMLFGKKVAGILVEAKTTGKKVNFIVVGIGLNINTEKRELPPKATSLYLTMKKKYNIEEFSRGLIKEVMRVYREFTKENIRLILEEALAYQRIKSIDAMEDALFKQAKEKEAIHLI